MDKLIEENVLLPLPPVTVRNPIGSILSSTIIKEVIAEPIQDLSTIEKVEIILLIYRRIE